MNRIAALAAVVLTAPAVPLAPNNPEVAQQWANQSIRPGEGQIASVELVDAPRSLAAHDPFHVKLRVTNHSDDTLDGFTVVPRRASAVGNLTEQRYAAIADAQEYGVVGDTRDVDRQLPPGGSMELELDLGLDLPDVGTYPIMLQLLDASGAPLDTDRFHIGVRGTRDGIRAPELTALYPVTADTHILPGETGEAPEDPPLVLSSDSLAGELAPDGRLTKLVDQYIEATRAPEVGYATCVALDPALIDTVDRMTAGYTIDDERSAVVEEPKRLRDSWGGAEDPDGEPGAGAQDAAVWLDKVRHIAATGCVVALPWTNADLNAVARTGDTWLMREAVERGPFVLQRVLGTTGVQNTVVTGAGYVEDGAAPALGWADHSRSTVMEGGMQAAWERAMDAAVPKAHAGAESSLERDDLADLAGSAAPVPEQPVQVLTAAQGRDFGWIAPGVMDVGYQQTLASILAATGANPETTGFSEPNLRYDYTLDSKLARDVSAAAAVRLAAQSAWGSDDAEEAPEPVLVSPPADWDAETAAAVLGTVAELVSGGAATPMAFGTYLAAPPEVEPAGAPAEHTDPTAFTDAEVLQVTQQAGFINDLTALMVPDPAIALTRYGFTLPLRRDLLEALTIDGRRAQSRYNDAVEATSERLGATRAVLNDLRASVDLIPPGNVYTRTSPSSPLLIVAQNGLPLPVETAIGVSGPDDAQLNTPSVLRIPARGSVTVQMTADLPDSTRETDLKLYLTSPSGQPISRPVDITVRTTRFTVNGWIAAAVLGVAGLGVLLVVRGARGSPPSERERKPDSTPHDRRTT
ncbi:hypothetical protein Q0N48_07945 [Corynebacterium ureicelerivorans]|uniref:DUF6049 family protein n=1 Tax=Corynebacterium ureicelerivorans TaxID=401472 RepID=UPI00264B7A13|nr:DUF6049 family protein [Corynebacterium ureicelerivorans]MDN8605921.1 hypothetical protein [Corynebacterium ureicelerivorans]